MSWGRFGSHHPPPQWVTMDAEVGVPSAENSVNGLLVAVCSTGVLVAAGSTGVHAIACSTGVLVAAQNTGVHAVVYTNCVHAVGYTKCVLTAASQVYRSCM